MNSTAFKRRPRGISGSAWRKIFEITNHCGKFSPRMVSKRRAAAERRKGVYAI